MNVTSTRYCKLLLLKRNRLLDLKPKAAFIVSTSMQLGKNEITLLTIMKLRLEKKRLIQILLLLNLQF